MADINNNDAGASSSGSAARQDDVEQDDVEMEYDEASQEESTDGELTTDGDSETVSDKSRYQVGQWVIVRYAGKRNHIS